jgi:hypothetical protein
MPLPGEARRPVLLGAALALALVVLAVQLAQSPARLLDLPLYDYVSFWAAGRLNLDGQDPYDPARLEALERSATGGQGTLLVMWPAPWALTLIMPFSRLDSHVSHLLWLAFQFLVLAGAVDWAWRLAGGSPERRWLAWLVAFTFVPSYFVLVAGQLGPLLLLGLVGFLHCLRARRPGWAGAFLVLVALKPQLTFLFWFALLLWAWDRRCWRLVLGGVLATVAALAWPILANPALPAQYVHSLLHRTPTHSHLSPLLGTALRLACGGAFWLQFVPVLPGLCWLAWYWRRHRRTWDWGRQLPALLFASFLTAPYGAWPFDLVLLLPALLQAAVALQGTPRRAILLGAGHLAVGLAALAQVLAGVPYFWFLWMTPTLLAGYLLALRAEKDPAEAPVLSGVAPAAVQLSGSVGVWESESVSG